MWLILSESMHHSLSYLTCIFLCVSSHILTYKFAFEKSFVKNIFSHNWIIVYTCFQESCFSVHWTINLKLCFWHIYLWKTYPLQKKKFILIYLTYYSTSHSSVIFIISLLITSVVPFLGPCWIFINKHWKFKFWLITNSAKIYSWKRTKKFQVCN